MHLTSKSEKEESLDEIPGVDLGFREGGVGIEIGAQVKRQPKNFG